MELAKIGESVSTNLPLLTEWQEVSMKHCSSQTKCFMALQPKENWLKTEMAAYHLKVTKPKLNFSQMAVTKTEFNSDVKMNTGMVMWNNYD